MHYTPSFFAFEVNGAEYIDFVLLFNELHIFLDECGYETFGKQLPKEYRIDIYIYPQIDSTSK